MSIREEIRQALYQGIKPPIQTTELHEMENMLIDRFIKIFEKRIEEAAQSSTKIGWVNIEQIRMMLE